MIDPQHNSTRFQAWRESATPLMQLGMIESSRSAFAPLDQPAEPFTHECLAIEMARSFKADDVVGVLQCLFAVCGTPEHIHSDNGPEFVAMANGVHRID